MRATVQSLREEWFAVQSDSPPGSNGTHSSRKPIRGNPRSRPIVSMYSGGHTGNPQNRMLDQTVRTKGTGIQVAPASWLQSTNA
jgi:hypothetical protein